MAMAKEKPKTEIWEDVWIPTVCGRCYCACGVRVHRVNGVAVKIEGTPDSDMGGRGGLCAKGESGLQVLYDPNRLNVPLKRTNPEKGLYVDPKWKEITWEEAFAEIVPRMKKIIEDNPKKLLFQGSVIRPGYFVVPSYRIMSNALGFPNIGTGGASLHCGQGAHEVGGMMSASWSVVPDFKYCNYAIYFGASKGAAAGHSAMITTRLAAEARVRGMKFVVFDPMCNYAGGKATEWVPIVPGTDGAVALCLANVMVNELGIYDAPYLKMKTNGPYLIGPDKRYVRDKETGKPLVWDAAANKPKVFNDPAIGDYALEGDFEVNGVKCQPAFQLLKQHLKSYTPDMASKISTVPAATLRRIATEFAEAASIGSTITIEGHTLPLRPASAVLFRGGQGHENSFHTCFAAALLNQLIGGGDVPGGTLGWPARSLGHPDTGRPYFTPKTDKDGFLWTDSFGNPSGTVIPGTAWTGGAGIPHMPERRGELDMRDIFSMARVPWVWYSSDQDELWEKLKIPYRIEMMISWGCNTPMSVASRDIQEETLKKIPFVVVFELFNNELTEGFADIVLPDCSYLELSNWHEGGCMSFAFPFGMEDWCFHVTQPVVKPKYERRDFQEVMWEIIKRLGKREAHYAQVNKGHGINEEYKLKPTEDYDQAELGDRALKSVFGAERGWEWFQKHGFVRWKKRVEEAYWRYFLDARVPIYMEFFVDMGEKMKQIAQETEIAFDASHYIPLVEWYPCTTHKLNSTEYDLYCFSYRDVLHTGSTTMEQPWLDEASRMNPYTYNITMNKDTAAGKGLKDGDIIQIESCYGRKVEGKLKVMEGCHPQLVGIAACSGHWAKGMPIARGKGTNFDALLELDLKHVDPLSTSIETSVRVKVTKKG